MTMYNMNATWGDLQNEYDHLPLDGQGLLFGMTEAEVFQQDPDELVFKMLFELSAEEEARDRAILSRVDFEATDMWAGVHRERHVPYLFFGTPGTRVIELILDGDGLHECRNGVDEAVRGLGHDLAIDDLTLHDLSAWDASAKKDTWKRYRFGRFSETEDPTTRSVFVRTPLEEYFKTRYPAWWTE